MAIPTILAEAASAGSESCAADTATAVRATIAVTRASDQVGDYAQLLAEVLHEVISAPADADPATTLRGALQRVSSKYLQLDLARAVQRSRGDPMTS